MLDFKTISSIFVGFFAAVLSLELLTRIVFSTEEIPLRYDSNLYFVYQTKSNFINSYGFRDEEWSNEKEVKYFFLLGDEKTSRLEIAKEKYYPEILQDKLKMNVLNLSVENWNIDHMIQAYIYFNKKFPAHYILLALSSDSLKFAKNKGNHLSFTDKTLWWLKNNSKIFSILFKNLGVTKKYIESSSYPHDQVNDFLNKLKNFKLDEDKILFTFLPSSKAHSNGEALIHHYLKENYSKTYIDTYKIFMGYQGKEELFDSKTGRYTELAHRIIKNRIHSYFRYLPSF